MIFNKQIEQLIQTYDHYNFIYVFKYLFLKIYQHIDFCMFAKNM